MLKFDEGPCFNWQPSEVLEMSDRELEFYAKVLESIREDYKKQMDEATRR